MSVMKCRICLIVFIVLCAFHAFSQNTLRPSLYFNNMNYYNPSAGFEDTTVNHEIQVYGKQKFEDNIVWNKPISVYGSYLGRISSISSFYQVGYMYDFYSYFNRHILYAGFGYQWNMNKGHQLSFGVRGVFNFDQMKMDEVASVSDANVKSFYFTPDLDAGIQYRVKGFQVGVGVKNAFANAVEIDGNALLQNQREVYANMSYTFDVGENYQLAPYALIFYGRNIDVDLGLMWNIYDRVQVAYQFRVLELRSMYTVNAEIYKGIGIGVGFDHSFVYGDMNLDFFLRYRF